MLEARIIGIQGYLKHCEHTGVRHLHTSSEKIGSLSFRQMKRNGREDTVHSSCDVVQG